MICAYSIEDIDQAFSTSKLRGYSSPFIGSRPGMVSRDRSYFRENSHRGAFRPRSPLLSRHRPSRLLSQCVRKTSPPVGQNDIKNLGVIRYHPEIEDVIRPVGVAPLDLPADDHITHMVADIVLAVNDEHYSVLYLGTGACVRVCVFAAWRCLR